MARRTVARVVRWDAKDPKTNGLKPLVDILGVCLSWAPVDDDGELQAFCPKIVIDC